MRLLLLVAIAAPAVYAAGGVSEWRANYEASLKGPDGWLSVAGLSWLHEGANTVELPHNKIILNLSGGKSELRKAPVEVR